MHFCASARISVSESFSRRAFSSADFARSGTLVHSFRLLPIRREIPFPPEAKPSKDVSDDILKQAVAEQGYKVTDIQ